VHGLTRRKRGEHIKRSRSGEGIRLHLGKTACSTTIRSVVKGSGYEVR
jgi:hypothetical protein